MTELSMFQVLIDDRPPLKKDAKKNLKSAKMTSQAIGTHKVVNAAETENNVDAGDPVEEQVAFAEVPFIDPSIVVPRMLD